jgi:hypothetical protein
MLAELSRGRKLPNVVVMLRGRPQKLLQVPAAAALPYFQEDMYAKIGRTGL